ncbi:MAG TPA: hypothetical protein DCP47_01325 [Phycisphaerales bacterium]|nr:hypothetical protein [Phycisphaerales bacterium]
MAVMSPFESNLGTKLLPSSISLLADNVFTPKTTTKNYLLLLFIFLPDNLLHVIILKFKFFKEKFLAKEKKKNKHVAHLIRLLIAAAALFFAFKGESLKELINNFSKLSVFVIIAAIALNLAGQFIFVGRWLLLLRTQDVKIKYKQALKLHFLGLFYNNCLPSSVGGDALRAWYVTKHTDKKLEAALSVLVDRIVGMACTFAMIFLAYWLIPAGGSGTHLEFQFDIVSIFIKLVIAGFALIFLAALALFIMFKSRKLRPKLFMYGFIFMMKWKMWSSRFKTAIKLYCSKPLTLLLAVVLSFTCQALPVFGLYLIGRELGIDAHIKYYYVFFPLSWVIGVIPISVGGAGVMELGLKGMFSQVARVTTKQGLGLALAQRIIWLLTSIPGVIIHITGKHLPEEERVEPDSLE